MAYALMPSLDASCPDAKMYISGHFKFTIITNVLGIVRHISLIDDDFKDSHPNLMVEKKTTPPDEDKSVGDASAFVPVLQNFFSFHPSFHLDTFLAQLSFMECS